MTGSKIHTFIAAGAAAMLVGGTSAPAVAEAPRACIADPVQSQKTCAAQGADAARLSAFARMRGLAAASGSDALLRAEAIAAGAAHACAGAEDWSEAARLIALGARAAGAATLSTGSLILDAAKPTSCAGDSVEAQEAGALERYRRAERRAATHAAMNAVCAQGVVGFPDRQARLELAAEAGRCGWLAAAGRTRALRGAERAANGESARGMIAVSAALGAYDTALSACRGAARAAVARERSVLAKFLADTLAASPAAPPPNPADLQTALEKAPSPASAVDLALDPGPIVCRTRTQRRADLERAIERAPLPDAAPLPAASLRGAG